MISYLDFSQSDIENSIKDIYSLANTEEVTEGAAWYQIANAFARTISNRHEIPLVKTAAIIASLSPATHWAQNILDAENLIINGENATVSTYHKNRLKALKFLDGTLNPIDHYIADNI